MPPDKCGQRGRRPSISSTSGDRLPRPGEILPGPEKREGYGMTHSPLLDARPTIAYRRLEPRAHSIQRVLDGSDGDSRYGDQSGR